MLFKQVQINIMLAVAAVELGKWLLVKAVKEEAETALYKMVKEQLLLQQDLVLAAAAAVEENLQVGDLLTNLVFSPLGRELHLVRQVAQAEQDLHNTAAEAAVAQARQELEDQEVLEEQAAQEFKMLFKQVQINIMLAVAAVELGKWLLVKAVKEEAETALYKMVKEQLLLQQDLVLAAVEMAVSI